MYSGIKWMSLVISVLQIVIGPQFVHAQSAGVALPRSGSPSVQQQQKMMVAPSPQNQNFQLQGTQLQDKRRNDDLGSRFNKSTAAPGAMAVGATQKVKDGPIATGGGENPSQKMRSLLSSLPGVLRAKGLQYFPEVDIQKLEEKLNSNILIEIENGIEINGAPKGARFDRIRNMIFVDPVEWNKLDEVAKLALAFHEVLGLMGIEGNDDYEISNRLLALEYLAVRGVKAAKNQILPTDFNDPQVIYWYMTPDKQMSFFYCSNRNTVSTCRLLGNRSFSADELKVQASNQYALRDLVNQKLKAAQEKLKGKQKTADYISYGTAANLGLAVVAIVLGFIFPGIGSIVPWAILDAVGGTFVLAAIASNQYNSADSFKYNSVKPLVDQANGYNDEGNLLNSLSKNEAQPARTDIKQMAYYLNQALLKIPVRKTLD